MSKMGEIRRAVKDFGGRKFTTTEIRKVLNGYVKTNQRLADLEALHEVRRLDMVKTGGRSMREWQEIKINESLMSGPIKKSFESQVMGNDSPWAKVYPEFFRLPEMSGTVHTYAEVA